MQPTPQPGNETRWKRLPEGWALEEYDTRTALWWRVRMATPEETERLEESG